MNITVNEQKLKQITQFNCLDDIIKSDIGCKNEIKGKVAMEKLYFVRRESQLLADKMFC